MAIVIQYVDLRHKPSTLEKFSVDWQEGMTALSIVQLTLGEIIAQQIADELASNSPEIMVSWVHAATDKHSGIGGIDSLEWSVPDDSLLVISYEDDTLTTTQELQAINWMLKNETP